MGFIVPFPIEEKLVFVVLIQEVKIIGHGLKTPVKGGDPEVNGPDPLSEKTVLIKLSPALPACLLNPRISPFGASSIM